MEGMRVQIGHQSYFSVDKVGISSGGLTLIWMSEIDVSIWSYSMGHIDARVVLRNGVVFRFKDILEISYETKIFLGFSAKKKSV